MKLLYQKGKDFRNKINQSILLRISFVLICCLVLLSNDNISSAEEQSVKDSSFQKNISRKTWVQDGKSLNINLSNIVYAVSTRHALNPSITLFNSVPYVAWIEIDSKGISELYVKKWDKSEWQMAGESLNIDAALPASNPSLSGNSNNLYIVWVEINNKNTPQIYVRRLVGEQWEQIGNSLNIVPTRFSSTPMIALQDDVPYVTWAEINSKNIAQVYVKKWNGTDWEQVGKSLNMDQSMHASSPSISFQKNIPYVTWSEANSDSVFEVYVKRWNGKEWEQVGKELNINPSLHAVNPSIAFEGNRPYVVFSEANIENIFMLYVKRWNGSSWELVGKTLNLDPSTHAVTSAIAFEGNRPYIIWSEVNSKSIFQIYVKAWDGTDWVRIGNNSINIDNAMHALTPSMTFKGNTPFLAWKEVNKSGIYQIYVKHLEN